MRKMLLIGALALSASTAFAAEVVVQPFPGPVIEDRASDEGTTTTKTIEGADGCRTKSVTHSDSETGDSVTRSKTEC